MQRPDALERVSQTAYVQQILDHASAAIFVKDLEGRYLFVNREFERITGLPGAAIVGCCDVELFPDEASRFRSNDAAVAQARHAVDFEDTVQTERGPRTYLSHRFPLFDDAGELYALGGIATDITERRRSEEALRAAALAVSSAEGDAVFVELCRYLAEILASDVAMIAVYADDDASIMRTLAVWLDGRPLRNFDYPLAGSPCRHVVGRAFRFVGTGVNPEFPPGTLFAAKQMDSYAALPLVDAAGRPLGLIAVMSRAPMHDAARAEAMLQIFAVRAVAEIAHKRSQEALRASAEQYRAIFNASADALVLWSSQFQRVDVNPAYERMYGYARDEAIGGRRGREITEAHRKRQEEIITRTLAGEHCREEIETVRRDGEHFPIEVRTIPFRHRGEPHVLAMIRDLTERRRAEREHERLEAQLRQAQKMEAIGHLTGGIAHDFHNLLTSILGYVTLAAERCEGSDAKLDAYLQRAALSCGRARDLIQQMLTFSRGRRGEPRPLTLAPLVRESVKLLRSSLPSTVELRTELDEETPPVLLDPVQLEQVLMNLAINARDAMRSSGRVLLAVRTRVVPRCVCASCRCNVEGERVELSVEDSGPGIPPDVQERMFEPFFTTKPVGQGSGMGLATVHGIVHEYGGHIVVESMPGIGTTFRVLLPALAAPADSAAPMQATGDRAPAHRSLAGRVAVIDDELPVARFMEDRLAHWGLSVATFTTAHEALDALVASDGFDLVITDQTMPAMTGVEFALAARALRPDLPIVLYTGYGDGITDADVARAGVKAVLRKPIESAELFAVLSANLQSAVTTPSRE
jgi:PAS domain S-box-containing protein